MTKTKLAHLKVLAGIIKDAIVRLKLISGMEMSVTGDNANEILIFMSEDRKADDLRKVSFVLNLDTLTLHPPED